MTYAVWHLIATEEEEEEKLDLFMKRIINFQQMIRYKGVLLRKDWRIITGACRIDSRVKLVNAGLEKRHVTTSS